MGNVQARDSELIDYPLIRYQADQNAFVDDHKFTSMETFMDIFLNGEHLCTSYCSPGDHEDLVVGILAQRAKIRNFADIVSLDLSENGARADVVTTPETQTWAKSAGNNPRYFGVKQLLACDDAAIAPRIPTVPFRAKDILACADHLLGNLAATHEKTNGVHSGIIWDQNERRILIFREDIGRHNVFDKLYGWMLTNQIDLENKVIIFSGRCSSEMMMKIGRMGLSTVVAKSVPTTLSLQIAKNSALRLSPAWLPGVSVFTRIRSA